MYFGVSALKVRIRVQRRTAMPGPCNINDICIVLFDDAIQMNVDEVLSRRSSPMPKQSGFNLCRSERFSQQGIFKKVNLPNTQIIRGAPVAVHAIEHVRRQRALGFRRSAWTVAVRGHGGRQSSIESKPGEIGRRIPIFVPWLCAAILIGSDGLLFNRHKGWLKLVSARGVARSEQSCS